MIGREELIRDAAELRLREVSERIAQLRPDQFHDDSEFVAQLQEVASQGALNRVTRDQLQQAAWPHSDGDCLASLRALCLGKPQGGRESSPPPAEGVLQTLEAHKNDAARRFQILTDRYCCPANFSQPGEAEIREYILTRLMVQDRAAAERSLSQIDPDDVLLKLNLIAIHAQTSSDLRFLDALNYYYELLPADWVPHARHEWLLPCYLGLYGRALAVLIQRNQTIAHSDSLEHAARRAADL
jgi:hypothetical protein